MRISFDLDGVITNSEKWFFTIINVMKLLKGNEDLLNSMEILYYSTRSVKYNPYLFLSPEDQGYIITARKPISFTSTEHWLQGNGINLPIIYIDQHDTIDWTNYAEASYISATRKADEITRVGIEVHFDNNPYIVRKLRTLLPPLSKVILIGGEPCLNSM